MSHLLGIFRRIVMTLHMCDAIIEGSECGKNTVYTLKDGCITEFRMSQKCHKTVTFSSPKSTSVAEVETVCGETEM